jgi:Flp pilus assembly protein TadB
MRNAAFALLALAALVAGGWALGWQGVLMALTVVVFLLMLQFTKLMRTMRRMSATPLGQTPSCLMLNSRLHAGLPLLQVLELAGSLGEKDGEHYRWRDPGGDTIRLRFDAASRLVDWTFTRAS